MKTYNVFLLGVICGQLIMWAADLFGRRFGRWLAYRFKSSPKRGTA